MLYVRFHAFGNCYWYGCHFHSVWIEQLSGVLGVLAESGSLPASLLLVLVEMHAVCLSRHPLQRAIARYTVHNTSYSLVPEYGGTC